MINLFNNKTFLFFLSLTIVALGHPAIIPFLCLFASTVGISFFWKILIEVSSYKKKFFLGFVYYSLVQSAQLYWLATTKYHGMGIVAVYILLVILIGVQGGLFALLVQKKNLLYKKIFLFPAVWVLVEWSRLYFFSGFAWNQVGLSWSFLFIPMQFAAFGGVFWLSFWAILCNSLFLNLLIDKNKLKNGVLFGVGILIPFVYGVANIEMQKSKIANSEHINVALVQTGLQIEEKSMMDHCLDAFIHPLYQWENIFRFLLTKQPTESIDLIVLPEYAVPFIDRRCIYYYDDFLALMKKYVPTKELQNTLPILKEPYAKKDHTQRWIISNGYIAQFTSNYFQAAVILGLDTINEEANEAYNAAFFFTPFKNDPMYYVKQKLLPIAEYMPFQLLRKISANYGISSFFTPGKKPVLFKNDKYTFSPSICYDDCFPQIVRKSKLLNPNILVNITNDGWYPFSNLPYAHFIQGRLRSVELGTSLVRSCNSGVTSALDPLGKIIGDLPTLNKDRDRFYQGVLFCKVPTYTYKTPYVIWGDAFVLTISMICVLFFSIGLVKKKNSSC